MPQRLLIPVLAIFVSLLWTLCFPFIELGLRESTPLIFATLRAAGGGIILLLIAFMTRRRFPHQIDDWLRIGGVALFSTTIGYGLMFAGGGLVSAGLATVLANTQPLIAAVLAVVLLREHCGTQRALALTMAFGGVILLSGMSLHGLSTGTGAGLLLLSAIALAIGNLLLKTIADRTDAIVVNGLQLTLGAVPLLLAAQLMGEPLQVPSDQGFWLALSVLTVLTTALGAVLWQIVLAHAPLNQINAVNFLIPAYALPMMLMYGDSVTKAQWIGGSLVLVAVAIVLFKNNGFLKPVP